MTIFTSIIVFLLVFWTVLFVVLPWGNKRQDKKEDHHFGGAPIVHNMKKKFLITFLVSFLIWGIISFLISIEVIDFYEISRQMFAEDDLK